MSCEKYRDLFDSVFDGEIKESRKEKLFAHLDACPECNLQFKLYEKMISGVEELDELETPPDLTAGVMKEITAQPPPWKESGPLPGWFPGSWAWTMTFAVVLLVTLVTFVEWDNKPLVVAEPDQVNPKTWSPEEALILGRDPARDDLVAKVEPPTASNPVAELGILLVAHQGEVEVYDQGTSQWKPVQEQAYLSFGDRIHTGESGVASLEYQREKVSLRVKPGSFFQVLDRQTLRVYAGNAWVNVKRKGTIFRTETPNAIASVRGTKYSVEVTPMADVYRGVGLKSYAEFVNKTDTPVPTADLGLYSTRLGLNIMKAVSGFDVVDRLESEIKVFESAVQIIAKDSAGHERASLELEEGVGSKVLLATIEKPRALTENDFLAWSSVMPLDQDLLLRSRTKVDPLAGTAGSTPKIPAAATESSGPVSESDHPAPEFDDVRKR